jgi:hypothetical protein
MDGGNIIWYDMEHNFGSEMSKQDRLDNVQCDWEPKWELRAKTASCLLNEIHIVSAEIIWIVSLHFNNQAHVCANKHYIAVHKWN